MLPGFTEAITRVHRPLVFLPLTHLPRSVYTVLGSKPDAPDQRVNPRQPKGGAVFFC